MRHSAALHGAVGGAGGSGSGAAGATFCTRWQRGARAALRGFFGRSRWRGPCHSQGPRARGAARARARPCPDPDGAGTVPAASRAPRARPSRSPVLRGLRVAVHPHRAARPSREKRRLACARAAHRDSGRACPRRRSGSTRSPCEFGASGCCCPRAARRGACDARSFLLFSGGAGRGSARAGVALSDSRPPRSSRHALTGRLDEHRDGARLKPLTFWCGTRAVTSAFGEPERLGLSPASSLASPTHYHRGTRRDWPRERAFAPAVLTVVRSLLLSCRRPPCTSGAQNGSRRASAWRHCRASYALSVSRFGSVLRVLPTLLATRRRRGDVHRSYSTFSLRSQA